MAHFRREKTILAAVAAFAQGLMLAGCQAGLGGPAPPPSPAKLAYLAEFKKIDTAGKGRITTEQATAYYAGLFSQLDRNGDGYLDAGELEAMLPALDAKSGKELVTRFDRNSDGKLSPPEFQIIVNWLFQIASSPNELALGDIQSGS
jgi:Ca2+-binding EF-hand superfamily protein